MKEDSFESQWKEALENASHTPPPEIWVRVEAELGKKKRAGFLIWKNPFLLSGVAAALILVLGTLFLFNNPSDNKNVTEDLQIKEAPFEGNRNVEKKAGGKELPETNNETKKEKNLGEIKRISSISASNHILDQIEENRKTATAGLIKKSLRDDFTDQGSSHIVEEIFNINKREEIAIVKTLGDLISKNITPLFTDTPISFDKLEVIPIAMFNNSFQKPISKIDIRILEDNTVVKKEKNGWFGVLAANAPFNPNFSTPGLQQQATAAIMNSDNTFYQSGPAGSNGQSGPTGIYTNTNRRDPNSNFRIGSALSYGVGFGKKIKKRLSIESGVRFTTARTSHAYNVYSVDKKTGDFNSFSLANYALSTDLKNSDVLISVNGSSQVTYNFLSIPILLNYNLLQLGRFNVNAIGGLSTEILVAGNIAQSKDVNQSFNAGNSNFKAVNLAGVGGVRLSYAVTKQLDVNLGSTYQHFLNSGIESSTSASFRPSMLGLNMGISVRR